MSLHLHGSGGEAARVARLRRRERAAALGRCAHPRCRGLSYNLPSTFGEEMPRTSVHVVQVLVPLAVDVVVGSDLEASEVRAVPVPSDDGMESSADSLSGAGSAVTPLGC